MGEAAETHSMATSSQAMRRATTMPVKRSSSNYSKANDFAPENYTEDLNEEFDVSLDNSPEKPMSFRLL